MHYLYYEVIGGNLTNRSIFDKKSYDFVMEEKSVQVAT